MIKAVDNFKKVKSYLERMGEPVILNRAISKEIIGRYNNILKDFTRTQVQDFLAVRADTSIVDDDNLLNEYYYCNLTYGQLKNKFGPTKCTITILI